MLAKIQASMPAATNKYNLQNTEVKKNPTFNGVITLVRPYNTRVSKFNQIVEAVVKQLLLISGKGRDVIEFLSKKDGRVHAVSFKVDDSLNPKLPELVEALNNGNVAVDASIGK